MCKVLQTVSVQICPAEMGSQAGFHNCQVSELRNIENVFTMQRRQGLEIKHLVLSQPSEKPPFFQHKTDIVLINITSH